jgi:hypothetical protein
MQGVVTSVTIVLVKIFKAELGFQASRDTALDNHYGSFRASDYCGESHLLLSFNSVPMKFKGVILPFVENASLLTRPLFNEMLPINVLQTIAIVEQIIAQQLRRSCGTVLTCMYYEIQPGNNQRHCP